MCSPAPVLVPDVELSRQQPEQATHAPTHKVGSLNFLRQRLQNWWMGWKQTLIAELASLGSPKEGFS